MGFSGIGIWEILLILIVALVVLGPRRLPEIARTLGKAVRTIKKASADLTTTVTRELEETKSEAPSSKAGNREPGNEAPSTSKTENLVVKKAPSTTGKTSTQSRDDQPTKQGGHQQKNE